MNPVKIKLNYRIFAICLVVSAISWIFLNLPKEYTLEIRIPVVYSGFFENKIRLQSVPNSIRVKLKGKGFDFVFFKLSSQKPRLVINYADLHTWNHNTLSCEISMQEWVNELSLRHLQPEIMNQKTIILQGEPLQSKTVPIQLNAKFNFEAQYQQHGKYTLSPSYVEVWGTAKELAGIQYVETVNQTLQHISKTQQYAFKLIPPIANQQCIIQHTTLLTLPVSQFTESSIDIPISGNNTDEKKIKYFPDKVTVKYTVALSDYKKVKPDMFTVEVLPAQSSNNKRTVTVSHKPDFINISKVIPETVEYIIFE